MGRSQIFEGIFSAVTGNTSLMTLLGTRTATNLRVYRNFPQLQSFLLGPPRYEPSTAEGWLVIEEKAGGGSEGYEQAETHFEVLNIGFHAYATHYAVADDVTDYLNALFHWTVEQQRDVQYGDNHLFFTRAYQSEEAYAEAITLPHKTRWYRMVFVAAEQVA